MSDEHHASIIREVASRIAAGGTAEAAGSVVYATKPEGGMVAIHCRNSDSAVRLLNLATTEAATAAYDPVREREAARRATLAAANKATLLHERNRWLVETDPYVLPIPSLPSDMPRDVLTVLSAQGTPSVQDQLRAWRQALRDYPSTVDDWTDPPPLPTPPNITLPSGRPLVIVT